MHSVVRQCVLGYAPSEVCCAVVDVRRCGLQACYSLASAQRRSRTAESGQPQADEHALHMEAGGPVFHDMQQVLHSLMWPLASLALWFMHTSVERKDACCWIDFYVTSRLSGSPGVEST